MVRTCDAGRLNLKKSYLQIFNGPYILKQPATNVTQSSFSLEEASVDTAHFLL
jgi:hypothetical protein